MRASESCPARKEAEEQERGDVGRLEVVQDVRQGLGGRRFAEEPHRRVEEAEAGRLGVHRWRWRQVGEQITDLRQHLRDVLGARPHLGADRVRVLGSEVAPEELDPRPVGRGASPFPAPAPQDPRIGVPGPGPELVGQTALPDPRLTREEEEAPPAGAGILEDAEERAHLRAPADEGVGPPFRPLRHEAPRAWSHSYRIGGGLASPRRLVDSEGPAAPPFPGSPHGLGDLIPPMTLRPVALRRDATDT